MKNTFLLIAFCATLLAACSESASTTDENQTSNTIETEVTGEDLKTVEETEAVKVKAERATSKVDSILNTL